MKCVTYILLFMLFISCSTKKVVAEKVATQTSELAMVGSGFASLQHSLLSYQLSTVGPDTPLEYTHEVGGKVVERITLKGGTLSVVKSDEFKVSSSTTSVTSKTFSFTSTKHKQVQRTSFNYWWLLLLFLALISYLLYKKR
jgi:lipoprotein